MEWLLQAPLRRHPCHFFVGLRLPSRTIYLTWQSPFVNLPQTKAIDIFDHLLDHYLLEQLNDL